MALDLSRVRAVYLSPDRMVRIESEMEWLSFRISSRWARMLQAVEQEDEVGISNNLLQVLEKIFTHYYSLETSLPDWLRK